MRSPNPNDYVASAAPSMNGSLTGSSVLVLEDETLIAEEICGALEAAGYEAIWQTSVQEALDTVRSAAPAALVIDRRLRDDDGLMLVETLRLEGNQTPALVVSGLSTVDDRIEGLKAGGDDYLVKPFEVRELIARVEALVRRSTATRATRLRVGLIEMDLVERSVSVGSAPVELVPREFKLLEYFMRRPNQIATRSMLLESVWNYKFTTQTNVVDVHIGNLRKKLDPNNPRRFIVNVRSAGFRLNVEH